MIIEMPGTYIHDRYQPALVLYLLLIKPMKGTMHVALLMGLAMSRTGGSLPPSSVCKELRS